MVINLSKFQTTLTNFYFLTIIFIFLIFVVTINTAFSYSYSQETVLPKSYHIQNNITVIPPHLNGETNRAYVTTYKNYSIQQSSHKSSAINNSLSFTIINAAITISEKIKNGTGKVYSPEPNQTIVAYYEKSIIGKKS